MLGVKKQRKKASMAPDSFFVPFWKNYETRGASLLNCASQKKTSQYPNFFLCWLRWSASTNLQLPTLDPPELQNSPQCPWAISCSTGRESWIRCSRHVVSEFCQLSHQAVIGGQLLAKCHL